MTRAPFKLLDLFSGIGGFSLGLERTQGFQTVAFCEVEPYCRAVLAKHWPDVPCYDDIRTLTADTLRRDGITVDAICGGFPCQDVSLAGKRAGLEAARSGLWTEYARLIGELRPRVVIVENTPGLLSLGMDRVLGSLSALGYDAVWDCIPASAVGAPHRRDRVWIVAYPASQRLGKRESLFGNAEQELSSLKRGGDDVAHANGSNEHGRRSPMQVGRQQIAREAQDDGFTGRAQWGFEPNVGRVALRIPSRVDRLKALGNSIVPQVSQLIGQAILAARGIA